MCIRDRVCILYAVTHDHLVEVPVELVRTYEAELYEDLASLHEADVLAPIRETGKLEEDTEAALKAALADFTKRFLASHT